VLFAAVSLAATGRGGVQKQDLHWSVSGDGWRLGVGALPGLAGRNVAKKLTRTAAVTNDVFDRSARYNAGMQSSTAPTSAHTIPVDDLGLHRSSAFQLQPLRV